MEPHIPTDPRELQRRITRLEAAVEKLCDVLILQFHIAGTAPNTHLYRVVELVRKELKK